MYSFTTTLMNRERESVCKYCMHVPSPYNQNRMMLILFNYHYLLFDSLVPPGRQQHPPTESYIRGALWLGRNLLLLLEEVAESLDMFRTTFIAQVMITISPRDTFIFDFPIVASLVSFILCSLLFIICTLCSYMCVNQPHHHYHYHCTM